MAYIAPTLRRQVADRAAFRCEYCQSPELITGGPFHVEHIVPAVLGGAATAGNLAYSCARCNLHKGQRTRYRDPVSGRIAALFNPRTQDWSRHFLWSSDGTRVIGRTRTGRATILLLQMNQPTIVQARSIWVQCNLHPPA
jgi:hypothetical protein